jgi:acetyl/propionyl-CoA carboxylase alpha subunit
MFDVPLAPGVRLDTGVQSGSSVPVFYDSLLAKIIVRGDDRAAALALLRATLAQTNVTGIATNLPLLRAIANDDAFAAADTTTRFLEERDAALTAYTEQQRAAALALVAGVLLRSGYGWRASGIGMPLRLIADGTQVRLFADRTADGWHVRGDIAADIPLDGPGALNRDANGIEVVLGRTHHRFAFGAAPSATASRASAGGASGDVVAPMPGKIVNVAVKPGDTVKLHDGLMILEAMKMEHRIDAPIAGIVAALHVAPGDRVAAGTPLVTIAAA